MKKFAFSLVACLVFLVICTFSTYANDKRELVKPIQVFNLDNGQTVIIKEVHTNPIVTIDTWIRTGSINEDDVNNGVSHFLEHLMFKGTEKYPAGEIDEILESKGAFFNAGTSKDYTHYYITIASDYADLALKLHADMLLNAAIPPDELEKERKVVIEEIRRAEDNPKRQVYYGLNSLMFNVHPYKYDTLGTEGIIQNISRDKILEYYHHWYVPQNMTTVIVGNINTDDILEKIKLYFGNQKAERMSVPVYPEEPPLTKNVKKIVKGDYKQAYMEIGFRAPSIKNVEETYALDVAAMVLGQGRTSRLYKRLKQDQNLVNSLFASNLTMKDDGIFIFDFNLQPENIEIVKNIVFEEIEDLKKNSVTVEELERAKNIVARDFIYSNESVSNIATSVGYYVTIATLEEYLDYVDNINAITKQDVKNALVKHLNTDQMAISLLIPDESTNIGSQTTEINNKEESTEQISENIYLKEDKAIQKHVLPNGAILLTKSNDANDVVSLDVYIKGGKLYQKKAGISNLTSNLLMKGTLSRSAKDIAEETENLGINLTTGISDDYISISMKSTRNDFTEGFMVLSDILKNSSFPEEEFIKAKESLENTLHANQDSPLTYSFENLYINIYPDHPYGEVGNNVIKQLPDIKRQDVIEYYENYFVPGNMVISVVGNISPEVIKRYFEQLWTSKDISLSEIKKPEVLPLKENKVVKVPKDTESAWISMGWLAPGITSKDYPALKVINSLLGGGLSSRLTKNLRVEKGLAYNVGCFYPSRMQESVFVTYIGTKPDNINIAIEGFKAEIERLKIEKVSEEELRNVKDKLIGNFILAHETNAKQAFYIGWFEAVDVGYEYDEKYPELVKQVTAEQIMDVARRVFDNTHVVSIVAPEDALKLYEE
jgi:zinc protease